MLYRLGVKHRALLTVGFLVFYPDFGGDFHPIAGFEIIRIGVNAHQSGELNILHAAGHHVTAKGETPLRAQVLRHGHAALQGQGFAS
mgnify:CR=1 FL=1